MAKQPVVAWCLLGGVVLLAGWWGLVPKIGTATEAEVRAHVAPELLQPLPHPEGGVARVEALLQAAGKLPREPKNWREPRVTLDLDNAAVREVIDILRTGPIDRVRDKQQPVPLYYWQVLYPSELYTPLTRISNGLAGAALRAAEQRDWARARQHMEASCLLLDRLLDSDLLLQERYATMTYIERKVYVTTLALAAHRDLPVSLAEHLSVLLVKDRHDPASLLRVLRGEMQQVLLGRIGAGPISQYQAGTYDPLDTAELLSARFLQMARESGLPAARRFGLTPDEARARRSELGWYRDSARPGWREYSSPLTWPLRRIRLNTAHNSIGRTDAAAYPDWNLMQHILRARSLQDQVAAALALVRFRQRAGRDPKDFAELVAVGLLRAVPMDHAEERPLPFDLNALFVPRVDPRTSIY